MDEDRTYLNTIIRIREGFEVKDIMSELERTRIQIILQYLDTNKEINSAIATELLGG
jgi:ATP-dependent DNA helicase RecG